jgi:hypothetical protein
VKLVLVVILLVVLGVAALLWAATSMPGRSYRGMLAPASDAQKGLAAELRRDVEALCKNGPRNIFAPASLRAAAVYIERAFRAAGYEVDEQEYTVDGVVCQNLAVEVRGSSKADEIVIVGAHYDSVDDSPGADDNASGVASMLALARRMRDARPARTIRFVAFTNEEPPHFKTGFMGSYRYARRANERGEKIVAMLSLESMGYFRSAAESQRYPPPLDRFYPDTGDFIAFAGNLGSRDLVRKCVATFRAQGNFPAEGAALPEVIQEIGWSDQWAFWQFGAKGLMVTDTALFRNPNYHRPTDTPETLDYARIARVVDDLGPVIEELAR